MNTAVARLISSLDSLAENVANLLAKFSEIYRFNEPGSSVIILGGDFAWRDLPEEGRQLQARLNAERETLYAILDLVTKHVGSSQKQSIEESKRFLNGLIDQDRAGYLENLNQATSRLKKAVDKIKSALGSVYDAQPNQHIFVVDTNALYSNPNLETWRFDQQLPFTLVLLPTVLADLDRHKVAHRTESVRAKAEGLIRRIKGYRSRGSLNSGVPLVSGISMIKTTAIEPSVENALPWLDRSNDDDRIIAACYELVAQNPRSSVTLVTGDINMQNKAEFAMLPYVEPPGLQEV